MERGAHASKGEIRMKNPGMAICLAVIALLVAMPGFSQSDSHQGRGKAVVTILPKHEGASPLSITGQELSIKVNGKPAQVTSWKPLQSAENSLELVLLIDGSARSSLANQFDTIEQFVKALPPNTKAAIAYMANGRAVFAGGLTADHEQVLRALHLPSGTSGSNASPYFCLSDLAQHWPSSDLSARREVVMVTDGVDNYQMEYDPDDPYVQAAIKDSVRAGVVVYAVYWLNKGIVSSTQYQNNAGQNHLIAVTEATGGKSFWMGMGNPVSLQPFFDELARRLRNQYELGFVGTLKDKPEIESLKVKLSTPGADVDAPQQVFISPAVLAQN
jgi:hypothetical protein